jgi:hypothetical protein
MEIYTLSYSTCHFLKRRKMQEQAGSIIGLDYCVYTLKILDAAEVKAYFHTRISVMQPWIISQDCLSWREKYTVYD